LKLTLLFAKYLYQHKQLNLPGIGVFTVDPSVSIPEITDKNYHDFLQHIRFDQKNIHKPDEELIDFIRIHTGKIRPLAESDLESFISEGKILLNIGKPFHLEGIGTLLKSRAGTYEFNAGLPLLDRLENIFPEKDARAASKQSYENDFGNTPKNSGSGRMMWIVLAILVGLGAIIWGGYSLYNRNTDNHGTAATDNTTTPVESSESSQRAVTTVPDTNQVKKPDSSTVVNDSPPVSTTSITPGTYKFIFRTSRNKNYVIKRYNDLKPSTANLFWDTKDSVNFRLYLAIPALPADTTRIRDSLQLWYGSKKVIIEQ
jgi:hypothetical protein